MIRELYIERVPWNEAAERIAELWHDLDRLRDDAHVLDEKLPGDVDTMAGSIEEAMDDVHRALEQLCEKHGAVVSDYLEVG